MSSTPQDMSQKSGSRPITTDISPTASLSGTVSHILRSAGDNWQSLRAYVGREFKRPVKEWTLHPVQWGMGLMCLFASEAVILNHLEGRPPNVFSAAIWPINCLIWMIGARILEKGADRTRELLRDSEKMIQVLFKLCDQWKDLYERKNGKVTIKPRVH